MKHREQRFMSVSTKSMPSLHVRVKKFQKTVFDFYTNHKRVLPWRETVDPYHIFVSEVMLQQTQVDRVVKKYQEFIRAFPSVQHLSRASFADVYRVWAGMGYNRRAKYLIEAARQIVEKHGGVVPDTVDDLQKLPGIGYNTACAIAAFAYNKPVVFIETNIRSVFIYELDRLMPRLSAPLSSLPAKAGLSQVAQNGHLHLMNLIHDKDILPLITQTLDRKNPREWYWALMDYGTYLKKTLSNPSRKSAHYTKQSTFEGSDRQLRGKILDAVLNHHMSTINLSKLATALNEDLARVQALVEKLKTEGLLL